MAKKISDLPKGSKAPRIGEGGYAARIVQVIRLGTQTDEYKGKEKTGLKVWITFEIPDVTIEVDGEERPRWISAKLTESNNEKANFTKLVGAASQHQDVETEEDLLNAPVMIQIGTTENGNDKITGYAAVPASFVKGVPALQNDAVYWDIDEPDMEQFEKFPDFLKDMITSAPEWVAESRESDEDTSKAGAKGKGAGKASTAKNEFE